VVWWALAALALPLLAWPAWQLARPRQPPPEPPVRALAGRPLFDGLTVSPPAWTPSAGVWSATLDAEKARVLSGQGSIRRRLPDLAQYRVSLNVDLHRATAVEVHFGIRPAGRRGQPRLVLRVAPEGVLLGRRLDDKGDLTRLSAIHPFPRSADPARSPYRAARVQRHAGRWWAYFDEVLIGSEAGSEELAEVRLVAEDGPALFEEIVIAELVSE
jgi:hypothetical protein